MLDFKEAKLVPAVTTKDAAGLYRIHLECSTFPGPTKIAQFIAVDTPVSDDDLAEFLKEGWVLSSRKDLPPMDGETEENRARRFDSIILKAKDITCLS